MVSFFVKILPYDANESQVLLPNYLKFFKGTEVTWAKYFGQKI